jgi:hypothetical protein
VTIARINEDNWIEAAAVTLKYPSGISFDDLRKTSRNVCKVS